MFIYEPFTRDLTRDSTWPLCRNTQRRGESTQGRRSVCFQFGLYSRWIIKPYKLTLADRVFSLQVKSNDNTSNNNWRESNPVPTADLGLSVSGTMELQSTRCDSLRSKRFCAVREQNTAGKIPKIPFVGLSLLLTPTEMLATQAIVVTLVTCLLFSCVVIRRCSRSVGHYMTLVWPCLESTRSFPAFQHCLWQTYCSLTKHHRT